MTRAEHPAQSAAVRKALLWVVLFYGGAFAFMRMSGILTHQPEILRQEGPISVLQQMFLPCYMTENLLHSYLGAVK